MTKRTLAKEILIFVLGLVIIFAAFVTLTIINSVRQSRYEEIRTQRIQLSDSVTLISETIESIDTLLRLERLYLFCKENELDVPDTYGSFESTLKDSESDRRGYFNYLKNSDIELPKSAMDNDYGYIPNEPYKKSYFDFSNNNAFDNFTRHYFDSLEIEKTKKEKTKESIKSQITKMNSMKARIKSLTGEILEPLDIKDHLTLISIVLAVILYPIRIIVQLTIWSLRTLRIKNE